MNDSDMHQTLKRLENFKGKIAWQEADELKKAIGPYLHQNVMLEALQEACQNTGLAALAYEMLAKSKKESSFLFLIEHISKIPDDSLISSLLWCLSKHNEFLRETPHLSKKLENCLLRFFDAGQYWEMIASYLAYFYFFDTLYERLLSIAETHFETCMVEGHNLLIDDEVMAEGEFFFWGVLGGILRRQDITLLLQFLCLDQECDQITNSNLYVLFCDEILEHPPEVRENNLRQLLLHYAHGNPTQKYFCLTLMGRLKDERSLLPALRSLDSPSSYEASAAQEAIYFLLDEIHSSRELNENMQITEVNCPLSSDTIKIVEEMQLNGTPQQQSQALLLLEALKN